MGVGKSTIGKKLSSKLGFDFIDTDSLFENRYKLNISTFFGKYGEDLFRKLENELLMSLLSHDNCVISTGGGLPCYKDSISEINDSGISVYLEMKEKVILSRLMNSKQKRPLIENLSEHELLQFITSKLSERTPYYQKAHITVPAVSLDLNNLIKRISSFR